MLVLDRLEDGQPLEPLTSASFGQRKKAPAVGNKPRLVHGAWKRHRAEQSTLFAGGVPHVLGRTRPPAPLLIILVKFF